MFGYQWCKILTRVIFSAICILTNPGMMLLEKPSLAVQRTDPRSRQLWNRVVALILISWIGGFYARESACNARDPNSIPGLGRSPGEGNDNILQYSCLENSMDRGAWWLVIPFSKGSSWVRAQTWASCHAGRFFTIWSIPITGKWVYSICTLKTIELNSPDLKNFYFILECNWFSLVTQR